MTDTGAPTPPEGPSPEVGEDYVYGPEGPDDGQQYVDRDIVPFDPGDGLLVGTAVEADADDADGTDQDHSDEDDADQRSNDDTSEDGDRTPAG